MSSFELRPLGLGELLDRAFLLYRRNFWLFVGIMAIPTCLVIPMQFVTLRSRGVPFPFNKPAVQSGLPAIIFVFFFIYWILYVVAQAATTYAVADAYLGQISTVRQAYGKIRGHFWQMMGVSIGVGLRVFGILILVVVVASAAGGFFGAMMARGGAARGPAVSLIIVTFVLGALAIALWFSMRYALSLPAVLLEDIKGRAAIRRSVQLSQGRRGQIFVAILLGMVVLYAIALLFQGPFYAVIAFLGFKAALPTWLVLGLAVSSSIGGAIAGPLLMIILVLCYYDSRIRKEGFDLQHMMTSLPQSNSDVSPNLAPL